MRNQEDIEKHLDDMLTKSEREIDEVLNRRLKALLDLLATWHRKYSDGEGISRTELYKYKRFEKEMELIKELIHEDYQELYKEINQLLKDHYKDNYLMSAYVYEMTALQEMEYTVPSADTIRQAIEHEIPELRLPKLLQNRRNETMRKIRIEIASGIQAGESYSTMAKRIENVMQDGAYNARRIARTESGRVQVQSRLKSAEQAQKHANLDKYWLSTLDSHTRQTHRRLDGDKADENGLFHIRGMSAPGPSLFVGPNAVSENVNCRCDVFYTINGQMPEVRRSRDYSDADYQQKLADRIEYLMAEEGLTENGARKRAKREVFPPSQVTKWQTYESWLKDQPIE